MAFCSLTASPCAGKASAGTASSGVRYTTATRSASDARRPGQDSVTTAPSSGDGPRARPRASVSPAIMRMSGRSAARRCNRRGAEVEQRIHSAGDGDIGARRVRCHRQAGLRYLRRGFADQTVRAVADPKPSAGQSDALARRLGWPPSSTAVLRGRRAGIRTAPGANGDNRFDRHYTAPPELALM